ncbi:hypothetical protein [uncultured Desulfobacter sp.]|uniref:hypothetical protein n=1 Tax=uncultured Desulfobacter sp. TaxID=240139 RepID=UPI002AABF440|nr:hypothetical protein [uncultured Desulfobacter sp.]
MKIIHKYGATMLSFLLVMTVICFGLGAVQQSSEAGDKQDSIAHPSPALENPGKNSLFHAEGYRQKNLRKGNAYAITMAEERLSEAELPKMVKGHPRLLVRPSEWKYGLSLEQLRERAKKEPWAGQIAKDMKKPPDHKTYAPAITHRALLYLITGDETLVPRIVEFILSAKPEYNVGGGLVQTALWYDWIYNSPSISNAQRRQMADKIAEVGLKCAGIFESGHAFDIWTHRGSPGWASDVLVAGLVLDDHPDASKLRQWGMGYFLKNYFRAWHHNDGAWMHGGSAYNIGLIIPQVIAYWASAVEGEDIYETIRQNYGNWLEGHLNYMMAEVLPDKTHSDEVAWDYNPKGLRIKGRSSHFFAAAACQNSLFYTFQRWLGEDPKSGHYGRLIRILCYDNDLDTVAKDALLGQPFVRLWGRYGPGYLQMRNKGWQADGTVVSFKCGDLAWTHTQVNHNNSFWIYNKGRLAVQGGGYGLDKCWHGGSGSHYFTQSISSNTMLIFQPDEFTHAGGPGAGDLIGPNIIPNPGGQRMRWAFGQTCFTFNEYLRRKYEESDTGSGLFESGDIIAFESDPGNDYAYVCGDATMAYNNSRYSFRYKKRGELKTWKNSPKIDLFTRSMIYLMKSDNLIIFDRVQSLDPSWRKAWICHFQGKPELMDGKRTNAEIPEHIEDFDADTIRMTWADGVLTPPVSSDPGRLFIRTLLPEQHTIRRIGGTGYQAWSNGKNRTGDTKKSDSLLKNLDAGRWRIEVSPKEARKFDTFMHVIHITDTRTEKMPVTQKVESEKGQMVGVAVDGNLMLFGRTGSVDGEVAYRAPKGKIKNLVVDLKPRVTYKVSGTAEGTTKMTASQEGTLRFLTSGPEMVRLIPTHGVGS